MVKCSLHVVGGLIQVLACRAFVRPAARMWLTCPHAFFVSLPHTPLMQEAKTSKGEGKPKKRLAAGSAEVGG